MVFLMATPVSASDGTIVINEPTTLTEGHSGNIVIGADGVTLDCDGQVVKGPGFGVGIQIARRTGVTVVGCTVVGFDVGINVSESSNVNLANNTVRDSAINGVSLDASHHNHLSDNQVYDSGNVGYQIGRSPDNTFVKNEAHGNRGFAGFNAFSGSDRNTFTGNIANRNGGFGFAIHGTGHVIENNVAARNERVGIELVGTEGVVKGNVAVRNAYSGFQVMFGVDVWVEGNEANHNLGNGIRVTTSTGVTVIGNTAVHNGFSGFFANRPSIDNTFTLNTGCHNNQIAFTGDGADFLPLDNFWSDNNFCVPLDLIE